MMNRPIKTRRLKKAELADDFFFMILLDVVTSRCDVFGELSDEDGRPIHSRFVLGRIHDGLQSGAPVLLEAPKTCQHYF
jgi:hypothetical protein